MQNFEYPTIPASQIKVLRSIRQRSQVTRDKEFIELVNSIERVGVVTPIVIDKDMVLIAGERRLEACRSLDPEYLIPYRVLQSESLLGNPIIEFAENRGRVNLPWQDSVRTVAKFHAILKDAEGEKWTQDDTANSIGIDQSYVSRHLAVSRWIDHPDILNKTDINSAYEKAQILSSREVDNIINAACQNDVIEDAFGLNQETAPAAINNGEAVSKYRIEQANFIEWASSYSGRTFDFIHCDFPYGIDHQNSEQGGLTNGNYKPYEDGEETYWNLCRAMLQNRHKIMSGSSHLMFWFSMKFYYQTIAFFQEWAPDLRLVTEHPLIWHKSDGKGIVSDHRRRPRNIYETALLFSRGDRKILTPIDNLYATPTTKDFHASEKPQAMLQNFFRMFVDEHCEMLDPTCGSGTSIRAAAAMGAKRALGLEVDMEFVADAQNALKKLDNPHHERMIVMER